MLNPSGCPFVVRKFNAGDSIVQCSFIYMRSPKKVPWCVLNASNQVVEEKFKCSGVFPNAWNVFKCYGMPTSAMGCLQVSSSGVRCLEMDAVL